MKHGWRVSDDGQYVYMGRNTGAAAQYGFAIVGVALPSAAGGLKNQFIKKGLLG